MSPTARSMQVLKEMSYHAQIVEVWNPWSKTRRDLFGMFDILAFRPSDGGVFGIQCTSGVNASARIKKLRSSELLAPWFQAGNQAEVWTWAKRGKRGERKLWTLKRHPVSTKE